MFCSICGAKIPDNSKFCMACGSRIPQMDEAQDIDAQEQEPVVESSGGIEYTFHGQKLVLGDEFQDFITGRR